MATLPDYFTGFTQAEVEAILSTQKTELAKTLASYSEGGSQVVKRRLDEINLIIRGCQAALRKFDPDAYANAPKVAISRPLYNRFQK